MHRRAVLGLSLALFTAGSVALPVRASSGARVPPRVRRGVLVPLLRRLLLTPAPALCVVAGKGAAFVAGAPPILAARALHRGAERGGGARGGAAATGPGGGSSCPARRALLLHRGGLIGLRGGKLDAGAGEGPMGGESGAPAGGALSGALLRVAEFGVPPVLFVLLTLHVVTDPAAAPEAVTFLTAACAAMMSECVTFPMVCMPLLLSLARALPRSLLLFRSLSRAHALSCARPLSRSLARSLSL